MESEKAMDPHRQRGLLTIRALQAVRPVDSEVSGVITVGVEPFTLRGCAQQTRLKYIRWSNQNSFFSKYITI